MNIVSPVDSFNEAESLIGSGANELYGGYWTASVSSAGKKTFPSILP
jgi:hypothetical protein